MPNTGIPKTTINCSTISGILCTPYIIVLLLKDYIFPIHIGQLSPVVTAEEPPIKVGYLLLMVLFWSYSLNSYSPLLVLFFSLEEHNSIAKLMREGFQKRKENTYPVAHLANIAMQKTFSCLFRHRPPSHK